MEQNDRDLVADVAERLRGERPEADPEQLDRIKARALATAGRHNRPKEPLMRSRLAITALLAAGILISGAGAGLAISGPSGSGSAGIAQYGEEQPGGGQLPDEGGDDRGGALPDEGGNEPDGGALPDSGAQAPRQIGADEGSDLPFTGYAAIPILLAGLGLLSLGVAMRRRIS